MKSFLAVVCLSLGCLAVLFVVLTQMPSTGLPTDELASGTIQPVPDGDLVIGVAEGGIAGMGGKTVISGPPGFLVDMGEGEGFGVEGSNNTHYSVYPLGAVFLPGGVVYTLSTGGDWGASFRFVAFGTGIDSDSKVGTIHYSKPVPWGPGAGKTYSVSLSRIAFFSGSSTPWLRHSGPVFRILDGGSWESRHSDAVTVRISAPGIYTEPAGSIDQLAQIGGGGYALSVEFSVASQPKATDASGPSPATPTTLVATTAVPDLDLSHYSVDEASPPALIRPRDMRGAWVVVVLAIGMLLTGLFLLPRTRHG